MFKGATSFNQPLDTWDVESVRYKARMLKGATSFQQALPEALQER
jgi:surface protein